MSALDILKNIGTSVGLGAITGNKSDPTIDPGMSIPAEDDTSESKTLKSGLDAGFVTVPGAKGSKMTLDTSSSEEILKKLQNQLDERNSPFNQFQNNLANAQAWTIGDPAQAAEAIKNRQVYNKELSDDTLAKQMEIAQFRAAQEQQKYSRNAFGDLVSSVGSQPPTNGAPNSVTSEIPGASSIPPNILKAAYSIAASGDLTAARDYLTKYISEAGIETMKTDSAMNIAKYNNTEGPEANKPIEWPDPANPGKYIVESLNDAKKDPRLHPGLAAAGTQTAGTQTAGTQTAGTQTAGTGSFHGVAADGNNAVGIKAPDGGFVRYNSPQEGVQAATLLNASYVSGVGKMSGIKPTIANMTGMFVNSDPNKTVPSYNNFLVSELTKNGININPDGTLPQTPEAVNALTAARIKWEAGKNAGKFLPFVGKATAPQTAAPQTAAPQTAAPQTTASQPTVPQVKLIPHTAGESKAQAEKIDAQNAELQSAALGQGQKVSQVGAEDTIKNEVAKQNEYQDDYKKANDAYYQYKHFLEASKGHKNVFNLAGQNVGNKLFAKLMHHEGAEADKPGYNVNDDLSQWFLNNEDQTHFRNVRQGEAVAQGEAAKNLVQGAGNRLTNADLTIGKIGKGVGADTTYEAHMQNMARNMETFKTMQLRSQGWDEFHKQNPNANTNDYEQSPQYQATRDIARKEVAKEFKDIPEANYTFLDKNKRAFVVLTNGKKVYIE